MRWLVPTAVVLGAALRLRQWLFDRSLWLDEILVSQDITGRRFRDLVRPLSFDQAAPIGWLWTEHAVVKLFGASEMSLRLFPLAASLLGLVLFAWLAPRLIGRRAAPAAVLLFATSPSLIYFSSEVKQYSSDACATLIVLAVTLPLLFGLPSWRRVLGWAAACSVVIAFSQPAILVTAAAGCVLAIRARRDRHALGALIPGALLLTATFAVDYVAFLRHQATSSVLQTFWVGGYPAHPLDAQSSLAWLQATTMSTLQGIGRFQYPALVLVICAVGLVAGLRRRPRAAFLLLIAPIGVGVAAAVAHRYPLSGRLALYLLPVVLLILPAGLGIRHRRESRMPSWLTFGLVSLLVAGLAITAEGSVVAGASVLVHPIDRTNGRGALAFVAAHRTVGDVIIGEKLWTDPDFMFYGSLYGLQRSATFAFTPSATPCNPVAALRLLPGSGRVWVVLTYHSAEPVNRAAIYRSQFAQAGRVLDEWHGAGDVAVYLLARSPHTAPPEPPLPPWTPGTCLRLFSQSATS